MQRFQPSAAPSYSGWAQRRPRRQSVTSLPVSSRPRVYLIVAACAVAAAGLTVGVTLATRTPTPKRPAGQAGAPPLVLDLGVRTDPEAVALRRAANLYNAGRRGRAAEIFGRYGSAGGAGRHCARGLACRLRQSRRAREGAPSKRARAAQLRARPLLARRYAGREGGLARCPPPRARHTVRAPRGGLALPELPPRAADVRAELPFPRRPRPAVAAASARVSEASGRDRRHPRKAALRRRRSSASADSYRRCASSTRRRRWPLATQSRRSPLRSGASTRPIRLAPSPGWGRWRSAIRRARACASTSASACSGSEA